MRRDLAWLALCLAAVIAVLWPLVGGGMVSLQHDLVVSDLHHSVLQYRVFQGRELASGHLPLWMPDVLSGVSLASQVEAGPWYLPNWLLFALLSPLAALNASQVLHALWAAAGAFLLARSLGAGRAGAALAGLSFALCGFNIDHFKHLNMHEAAAWLPWAWLALDRARQGSRVAWVGLSAALAAQLLAGHPQVSWLSMALLGFMALLHGLTEEATGWRQRLTALARHLGGYLGAVVGAGLVAAITLVPAWHLSQATARAGGADYDFATQFVLNPAALLSWVLPHVQGAVSTCDYGLWGIAWEQYVYQGLVPLLAAVFAAVVLRKTVQAQIPTLVAVGAVIFALLPLTPLYRVVWALLPGLSLFRFPHRSLLLAALALSVLAGLGLTAWQRAIRADRGPRAAVMAGVLLLGITAADLGVAQRVQLDLDVRSEWSAPGPALEAIARDGPQARVYSLEALEWWGPAYDASCAAGGDRQPFRDLQGAAIMSASVQHGVDSADGYVVLVPERLEATWSTIGSGRLDFYADRPTVDELFLPRLRKAGITHVFSLEPLEGLEERPSPPAFHVYAVPEPAPRAYTTGAWVEATDLQGAMTQVDSQDPRPAVEGAPASPPGGDTAWSPVPVPEHTPNRVVVDVSGRSGLLVLNESWDPGWSASIDGRPAEVLVVNGTQRGVLLPQGASQVVWTFWPQGLTVGITATLLGLLALLGLAAWGWKRRA